MKQSFQDVVSIATNTCFDIKMCMPIDIYDRRNTIAGTCGENKEKRRIGKTQNLLEKINQRQEEDNARIILFLYLEENYILFRYCILFR